VKFIRASFIHGFSRALKIFVKDHGHNAQPATGNSNTRTKHTMKLMYFDAPGRAEPVRILLHAAKVDWTDERVAGSDWPKIKGTTPLGSMPTLTVNGTDFCQSVAIQRYAAKLAGFDVSDPFLALIADETIDVINEIMSRIPKGETPEEKKQAREAYQANEMKMYFGLVESRIQTFGGPTSDTVCGTPSLADITLMVAVRGLQSGFFDFINVDFFKDYPGILACVEHMSEHEMVKSYYASLKHD
jgi:prostaglandin-H2 D-isomerase / glutathione transferase